MEWMILSLLSMGMYIPGLLLRYLPFARMYSARQKKSLFVVQGILLLVNGGLFYLVGTCWDMNLSFVKLSLCVFSMVTTGVNIAMIRGRWKEHLFTCGFSMLEDYCVVTIVAYGVYHIRGLEDVNDFIVGTIAFILLFIITFPVWRRILLKSVTPFLTIDCGGYWNTIWFIPIAMFLTCYVAMPGEIHTETIFQIISRLFILSAAVFVCLSVARDPAIMLAQLEMERRLNVQEEYYAQLAEQVEKARKSRHDFKHHIMAIRQYMKKDDKEGLALYCDQLLERNTVETEIPYTGNSAVDGVIYHYALLAKKHDIRFDYPAVCKNPGFHDMDFCVLLGNALDNAVAGCLTVQDNRYITVIADGDGASSRLLISNSFDGSVLEEGGRMLSRKRGNRSGVGIDSMRNVCEKYGAAMDIRYDENTFYVLFVFADGAESV